MTEKPKMSLTPPQTNKKNKLKKFIEEPEKKMIDIAPKINETPKFDDDTTISESKTEYPWEAPGVTSEIIKPFVLRMKQPDKIKADFIVANSLKFRSLQDFCMKAILKQIDEEIKMVLK